MILIIEIYGENSDKEAKAGYNYPTIRLPHTFSKLAGSSTRIYLTVHEWALAFLVVVSPTENVLKMPKAPSSHGDVKSENGTDEFKV